MPPKLPTFLQLDITDLARDFYLWWRAGLVSLVPKRTKAALETDPRRVILATDGSDWQVYAEEVSLGRTKPTDRRLLAQGNWENVEATLVAEQNRWRSLLTAAIRVPASACLTRTKDLPTATLNNATELLLLDMESRTPFQRSDVYWDWYQPTPGTSEVSQIILKRARVADVVDRLNALGIHLTAIEIELEDGTRPPVNLWPRNARRSFLEIFLGRAVVTSLLIASLAAASILALALYRQDKALELLQTEKAALAEKAGAIRKGMTEMASSRSQLMQARLRRAQEPRMVQVWEEISRILPTTAWATEFRADAGTITLDVLAPSASELIAIFAKSPLFREVAFASTVTRDAQRNFERVQIRMSVAQIAATSSK